jgi:predicted phage tail protein
LAIFGSDEIQKLRMRREAEQVAKLKVQVETLKAWLRAGESQ